jgi:hypothetical protein
VGKATKGCSDLPACRADRAEFLASHSALPTCPGLQWLGHFPSLAATNKCLAQSNKPRTGAKRLRSVRVVLRYRRREMTKEEQVVGLIFQVTMWAYVAAAAAYVVIG